MKCPNLVRLAAGLAIFVSIFVSGDSLADDVKVIANSSVKADAISAADLRRVFLEERIALADGSHVEPVLEKGGPVHAAFLEYLGISEDDLQTYYRTLVFTGKGSMPKELGSDAEVVAYVARTRGAIGYVSSTASAEGVKTLTVGDGEAGTERKLMLSVKPVYPETLRQLNIGGTVRLRVFISAKGKVEEVRLLGGNPILGEAAMSAVMKWVYAPGKSQSTLIVSILFDGH
jgi:TonB family protein